jgi:hypothetical protein
MEAEIVQDVGSTRDLEAHLGHLRDGLDSPSESSSFTHSQSYMLHTQLSSSMGLSSALESGMFYSQLTRTETQMSTILEECSMQGKLQVKLLPDSVC